MPNIAYFCNDNQNINAMTYLDPKADLTFKKVFGEHEELVKSLLNALLPFQTPEEEVLSLEYLSFESMPETPLRGYSIVDVCCKNKQGQEFMVEIQMVWSQEFIYRVQCHGSIVFARRLGKRRQEDDNLPMPLYSLNISDKILLPETKQYYHYFPIVYDEQNKKEINGLHLVLIELPKFKPQTCSEKKMHVLWLRYLTEINKNIEEVPAELLESPEIREAVTQLKKSAFTEAQLYSYERFWDMISVENTLINSIQRRYTEGYNEGRAKGEAEGRAEGRIEGRAEGKAEEKRAIASAMKAAGIAVALIASTTGLSEQEIVDL